MSNHFMSKTGLLIIMVLLAGKLCAQNYFVFLSTEDRQPFYVRLDSTMFSSTPDGHLILAPLKDSTYQLTIGFPGETTSEQRYVFSIREKDQEFQLKKRGDAGWGLFDQQSNEWLTPEATAGKTVQPRLPGIRKDDAFSRMMADVVGDTAVLYNTYTMEQALNDSPLVESSKPAVAPSKPVVSLSKPIVTPSKPAADTPAFVASPAHDSTHVVALSNTRPPADSTRRANTPPLQPLITSAISPGGVSSVVVPPVNVPHADSALHGDSSLVTANSLAPATSVTRPDSTASAPSHSIDSTTPQNRGIQTGAPLYRPHVIARLSERQTARGLRQVYTDRTGGDAKADTIVVIIPPDTPVTAALNKTPPTRHDSLAIVQAPAGHRPRPDSASTAQSPVVRKPRIDSGSTAQSSATHKKDTTQLVEIHPIPAATNTTVENNRPHPADSGISHPAGGDGKPEAPFINSDCHVFATDYDVDKLRMKMLEAVKEEERIATARKAFKTKCFTTSQLRILSEVFGTDGGRFRFFEAAWPFAADAHFRELSSLLTDPAYTAKFKSLTGQK
jgi:hypothetical protein